MVWVSEAGECRPRYFCHLTASLGQSAAHPLPGCVTIVLLPVSQGGQVFIFHCTGTNGGEAQIRIQALDWTQQGEVQFACNDDNLACLLLQDCRSDTGGFFNLLAGCKPVYVEQWLHYLEEGGRLKQVRCQVLQVGEPDYAQRVLPQDGELQGLLELVYQVGGFNRLQITRYLKLRQKPSALATRYSKPELERYRLLNDVICRLMRLKHPETAPTPDR